MTKLLLAAALAVGCVACTVETPGPTREARTQTVTVSAEAETPTPEPDTEPKGTYKVASCDWSGSYGASGFVGSVKVVNTGDVTFEARVEFAWQLGDGSKLTAPDRVVTVGAGSDKLVFFKNRATLNSVSLFQAHPGYMNSSNCKGKAVILT